VIRVLVADDHAVVRSGIAQLIESAPDLELVAACEDGASAVAAAAETAPDVALMDLAMPGMDGIEATREIVRAAPKTHVVILTSYSDTDRILAALESGAVGYLLKDAEPEQLLDGIRAAARGESPLAPKAARLLLDARLRPASDEPELSDREREVLSLVAAGLPNKVIAQRLGIAEKTVKAHLTSVYRTIGVYDRVQAALWARDRGLTR
jgi:DNA-binding NarL/FixJ family response regulator